MFIGKVVGTVWATKKVEQLQGWRFLIIHPLGLDADPGTNIVIVTDPVGAGVGELVLCAYGHAARVACGNTNLPIEAGVIGIVDALEWDADVLKKATADEARRVKAHTSGD